MDGRVVVVGDGRRGGSETEITLDPIQTISTDQIRRRRQLDKYVNLLPDDPSLLILLSIAARTITITMMMMGMLIGGVAVGETTELL